MDQSPTAQKGRLPFRLGSTSYVYPADILPNAQRLAGLIDDIELVLFEMEDCSNLPDDAALAELRALAQRWNLTYTVHLPLDLRLADADTPSVASLSMRKALTVIERTRRLFPYAYIVHLDGQSELARGPAADWSRWRSECARALRQLMDAGIAPAQLCIENLERYPAEEVLPVLDLSPVSLCLDVGHLWYAGLDPLPFYRRYAPRVRVIHLHGVGERDHQSLRLTPAEQVHRFLDELLAAGYAGVATLEVFSVEDFFSSRQVISDWAARRSLNADKPRPPCASPQ